MTQWSEYLVPEAMVLELTGLTKDALALHFLSPQVMSKRVPIPQIPGAMMQVKRPVHGDAEMRGAVVPRGATW